MEDVMRLWFVGFGVLGACSSAPVVELGQVPGTATVSWSTGEEGQARVVYHQQDDDAEATTPLAAPGEDHEVAVLGLEVGRAYTARVEVETGSRTITSPDVDFTVPPPPEGLPPFNVNAWEPAGSCASDAHVLFSVLSQNSSAVGVVNRDGRYVWGAANDIEGGQIGRPRAGRDGQSILWNTADEGRIDDTGYIVRLNMDGSVRTETRARWAHHDFVELPDGRLCFNGYDFTDVEGERTAVDTLNCVQEGATDPEQTEVLWTQLDPKKWPVALACTNTNFLPGICEYAHGNSLAYLEADGSFLVMLRWLDALVKISASGETEWILGGAGNEFTPVQGASPASTGTEADLFLQAHFSDAWYDDSGTLQILVFDNGVRPPVGDTSRLVQYSLDETAKTYSLDWTYVSDQYENLLGDVRRSGIEGCDNLMVSFSTQGRLVELTPEGDIVWDIVPDFGRATTRLTLLPDLYDFGGAAYP